MGRRANAGISASPLRSAGPGKPLHRSAPSLYPHHRAPRCSTPPNTFPLPHSSSRTPIFPSRFPTASPNSASPQCQDHTTSLLSFPTKFNLTETRDSLSPQRIPSPEEGVASTWIRTKRGLYGCNTTQELGGPCVFPPHSYTGTWACNPIPPLPPLDPSWKFCLPGGKWASTSTVGKEALEGGQATATRLGESNVSPYTVSLCTGVHAEGLFMNSGKYLFWKIHTSKENTLIHPLNTLAVLAPLHVWTLLLARAAL